MIMIIIIIIIIIIKITFNETIVTLKLSSRMMSEINNEINL